MTDDGGTPRQDWKRCVSFAGVFPSGHVVYRTVKLYGGTDANGNVGAVPR